jgi:hypothetical protein
MADALGGVFGTTVTTQTARVSAATYEGYSALVSELGRYASRFEYTKLLARVREVDPATLTAPAGQDPAELLAFYEVLSCSMLKRSQCVLERSRAFLERWPDGTYVASVESFLTQVEDEALDREAAGAGLEERLAEIAAMKVAEEDKLELRAAAYFAAKAYERAAALYLERRGSSVGAEEKYLSLTSMAAMAFEFAGDFDGARKVLETARSTFPKGFRRQRLHQHLRRLPK